MEMTTWPGRVANEFAAGWRTAAKSACADWRQEYSNVSAQGGFLFLL